MTKKSSNYIKCWKPASSERHETRILTQLCCKESLCLSSTTLNSCVILVSLLNLLGLFFLICKIDKMIILTRWGRHTHLQLLTPVRLGIMKPQTMEVATI